ncbi:MAG: MGMT family protein [Bryobacterales bacterium]|nr:MGMT family protein [Bryobacterales bacterium]
MIPCRLMQDYTKKVLAAVRRIPRGKVATYGEIAEAAGYPGAARAVATALRAAGGAAGGNVPWWRVIGSGGKICLRGGAAFDQRMRLEQEGVKFRGAKVAMR